MAMAEFITLEEVASYLRVTKKTIYRLLEKRAIPATRVGRLWRFEREAIDTWLHQQSTENTANILVIDDDEETCSLFKDILEEEGHTLTLTTNPLIGLKLIEENNYDLAFLDLKMPAMDGAEVFKRIRKARPELPVTIITGYLDSDLMKKAMDCGPFGVMSKPFNSTDILTSVNSYLRFGMPNK